MIEASVVVPTYRRPDLLARCLDALAAQRGLDDWEVIVVDDDPSAATRAVVDGRAFPVELRYIPNTGRRGPAAARNIGWRAARGRVVAFTDDDCIPRSGWLAAGVEALVPGVVGVTGTIVVPTAEPPTDYERAIKGLEHSPFATASCFYLRSALATVGGFDERYRVAWREDSDVEFSVARLGRLAFAPDAVVVHPVRAAGAGVSLREQRKAMYNALLYKKFPGEYRREIQSRPPLGYYGACLGALFALAGVVAGSWIAVALGVAGWAACVGAFIRRRLDGISHKRRHVIEMVLTSVVIPPLAVFWRLRGAFRFRVMFV